MKSEKQKLKIDAGDPPVEKTVLAAAILDLARSSRKLLDSRLNERAIALLLSDSSGVSMTHVRAVLHALRVAAEEYRKHRAILDARDKEIAKIYRQIAKGKTVISVHDAIRAAGIDELGRPRLAIMRADQETVRCRAYFSSEVVFTNESNSRAAEWHFEIQWPNRVKTHSANLRALLPRIPPKHRPPQGTLSDYHILWEADWTAIPRDPYLLKRIGKDAWVVLAAWDLTEVEVSVLRAHSAQ